jgi:hypothetical protein
VALHHLDVDDRELILAFAGCSLDEKPGSNWVQDAGGLPEYICQIAKAIKRGGKSTSQAIAIAVSRVKVWATGKGVDAKTQAKAAEAVAAWEALRAKSKAKKVGKAAAKDDQKVKASMVDYPVLNLSDYNMDTVRQAFDQRTQKIRTDWRTSNPNADYDDGPQRFWVREVWNSYVIVQSSYGNDPDLYKVPYTVDDDGDVTFGDAVEVKQTYVEVADAADDDDSLTDDALQQMMAATGPCPRFAVDKFLALTPTPSALDRVLALTPVAPKLSAVSKFLRETTE